MSDNGRTAVPKRPNGEARSGIVLMGMKHSGKSTLGRALAEVRRLSFIDLDDLTEAEHDPRRALSCREIFRRHGEEYFRELEGRAASRLASLMQERPLVAALGGGTIENADAMERLAEHGLLVYLEEAADILYARIMAGGRPAYLGAENPRGDFLRIYQRRTALFRERAHLVVHLMGTDIEGAFAELVRVLSEAGYAG